MDKIDIRDLRVGNWVMVYPWDETPWEPEKITDINFHSWEGTDFCDSVGVEGGDELSLDRIKPIPLTEETLKKNFKRYDMDFEISDGFYISWNKSKEGHNLFTLDNLDNNIHLIYLNYVHQLQNILIDFGVDKEIIL